MTRPYEKIRAISTTVQGDRFVVSEWNSKIQVWDISGDLICRLDTDIFSGMDKAISLSENGKLLSIAGYEKNTVTLYDIESAKVLWQRRDIKRPAKTVILNNNPGHLYLDTEKQGSYFLNLETGETIEKLKGVQYIRESPFSSVDQYEKSWTSSIIDRKSKKLIKNIINKSFALLDSCFTEDKIVSSYATNPLECVELKKIKSIWTTKVVGHFLEIEYCKELNKILGIRWEYEKESPKYLCYINMDDGQVEKEINLGEPIETEFLKLGSLLLTSKGELISTINGLHIKQFDFENN